VKTVMHHCIMLDAASAPYCSGVQQPTPPEVTLLKGARTGSAGRPYESVGKGSWRHRLGL